MSAKDIFHDTVRSALEKDGWTITHDPLFIKVTSKVKTQIDLGAEKLLSAERGMHKIAVEVKSFVGLSAESSFSAPKSICVFTLEVTFINRGS